MLLMEPMFGMAIMLMIAIPTSISTRLKPVFKELTLSCFLVACAFWALPSSDNFHIFNFF